MSEKLRATADAVKSAAYDQAAYIALYPDSGVSKAYHLSHFLLDPVGTAAPALRTFISIVKTIGIG